MTHYTSIPHYTAKKHHAFFSGLVPALTRVIMDNKQSFYVHDPILDMGIVFDLTLITPQKTGGMYAQTSYAKQKAYDVIADQYGIDLR